jgi:mannosyl-3-phosphoglycerate phosphatase
MEHDTYSISPAEPLLAQLRLRGIMLVMNSSKTAVEIEFIQQRLGFSSPFVCENGAALHFPDQEESRKQVFGRPRSAWLPEIHALRRKHKWSFQGFSDWSEHEISELTGLGAVEARLARQREFSEPILWAATNRDRKLFESQLSQLDLKLIEGGRFFSIQGSYDKSVPMRWLERQHAQRKPVTVALGDSPNDSAMLNAAQIAVVIKSAKSSRISLQGPEKIIHTSQPGPAGWVQAMTEILAWHDAGKLSTFGS